MNEQKTYPRVMGRMWRNPNNEQRPKILEWLNKDKYLGFKRIIDIGAGDAYYLDQLAPDTYCFVEPNPVLYKHTFEKTKRLHIPGHGFKDIYSLLKEKKQVQKADSVFLVHTLLYLSEKDITSLVKASRNKIIVIIYPDPKYSTTIAFEQFLGCDQSLRRIELIRALLGKPSIIKSARTHFVLPINTPLKVLAFLISNNLRTTGKWKNVNKASANFVKSHLPDWQSGAFYRIPQGQQYEIYLPTHMEVT